MTLEEEAWNLWESERYEQALPLLEGLYSHSTNQEEKIELLDAIACCFVEIKQWNNALDAYYRLLELDLNDVDTLSNIGNVLTRQGNIVEAIKFYQKSLDNGNTNQDDMVRLAQLYHRKNNISKALDVWNKIISYHPNYAPAYEAIGYIEAERHNYGEAVHAYQKAMEIDFENPRLAKAAIALMINMRQFSMAKQAISLILDDNREDAELIYYLAVTEYHSGEKDSAVRHLISAIGIQPSLTPAQELLQQIQQG